MMHDLLESCLSWCLPLYRDELSYPVHEPDRFMDDAVVVEN